MRVPYGELKSLFEAILVKKGFTPEKAGVAAGVFADNSCDGVASHGLNRFPRFVSYIESGSVDPKAEPKLEAAFGALERWNGNLGVGCTNAAFGITRAMELAAQHGIGCVAMRCTNHWMRGGTYGLMAARAGYAAICWTNTTANVPAWGAKSCNVGNNPLVMAYPGPEGPMVMDGALAQYSYGALEAAKLDGRELPFPGGFDRDGKLTADPSAILETQRVLPIGLWKGSGYALLLDAIVHRDKPRQDELARRSFGDGRAPAARLPRRRACGGGQALLLPRREGRAHEAREPRARRPRERGNLERAQSRSGKITPSGTGAGESTKSRLPDFA